MVISQAVISRAAYNVKESFKLFVLASFYQDEFLPTSPWWGNECVIKVDVECFIVVFSSMIAAAIESFLCRVQDLGLEIFSLL